MIALNAAIYAGVESYCIVIYGIMTLEYHGNEQWDYKLLLFHNFAVFVNVTSSKFIL